MFHLRKLLHSETIFNFIGCGKKVVGCIPSLHILPASECVCWLLPLYKDKCSRPAATLNCPWCLRCQCDWLSVFLCGPAINGRPVRLVLHLHRQTAGMDSGSGDRKCQAGWLDVCMYGWMYRHHKTHHSQPIGEKYVFLVVPLR